MRVLLITDGIHPFVMGGMQKHSYYLGKFLAAKGVRVQVVHCAPGADPHPERTRAEFADMDTRNISFRNVPFPKASRLPGHYIRESKRYSQAVYDAVRPQLPEFDLVYCQGFTGWAFIRAKQRGEPSIPVLTNLHGYEMFQPPPSALARLTRGPLRRIAKAVSIGSDGVFSFGGRITDILRGMGIAPERILECPIGIEASWLVPEATPAPGAERVFVFVGRDERRKAVKELSAAIRALITDGEQGFRFHFIGPIDPANRVADPRVVYHGPLHEEQRLQGLLRDADVLVCASFSEGMPTVIMEGMASRLAILATDVGAVGQQVGDNGWLLPGPTPAANQAALRQAIHMPWAELDTLKARSLAHVKARFTWERVIERHIALMEPFVRAVR